MRKDTLYLTLSRDITSYTITSGQRAIATNVNYAVTIESPTLTTNLAGRDVSLIISDTDGNTLTAATTFYPDTKNPYKAVTGSLLLDGGVYGKFFDGKPVDTAVRLPIVIRDKSATLLSSDIVVANGGEVAEPSASDEIVAGLVNAIRFYDLAEFKAWLDGTKERPDGLKPTDIVVGQWVHTQQDGSFICKELIGAEPSVTKNFTTIVTQFPLTGTLKMNPDNGIGLSVYSGDVYNDAEATSYSVDAITYKGDAFTFTAGDNQVARQKDNYALENRVNNTMTAALNAVKADNANTYQAMLPVMNTTVEARDRAETAARGAKSSETRAVEAEANAATSEQNALAYKNSAAASEENAGLYRQHALASAQKAEQEAVTATTKASEAVSSASNAAASATDALYYKKSAEDFSDYAESWSHSASEYAAAADTSADLAKMSEDHAAISEANAAESATSAASSESNALSYKNTAVASADLSTTNKNSASDFSASASASASAAASSATAAANSAVAAAQSAQEAAKEAAQESAQEAAKGVTAILQGKVDAAEVAKTAAETAKTGADAAKAAAASSATSAANSATAAAKSATELAEAVSTAKSLDGRVSTIEGFGTQYKRDFRVNTTGLVNPLATSLTTSSPFASIYRRTNKGYDGRYFSDCKHHIFNDYDSAYIYDANGKYLGRITNTGVGMTVAHESLRSACLTTQIGDYRYGVFNGLAYNRNKMIISKFSRNADNTDYQLVSSRVYATRGIEGAVFQGGWQHHYVGPVVPSRRTGHILVFGLYYGSAKNDEGSIVDQLIGYGYIVFDSDLNFVKWDDDTGAFVSSETFDMSYFHAVSSRATNGSTAYWADGNAQYLSLVAIQQATNATNGLYYVDPHDNLVPIIFSSGPYARAGIDYLPLGGSLLSVDSNALFSTYAPRLVMSGVESDAESGKAIVVKIFNGARMFYITMTKTDEAPGCTFTFRRDYAITQTQFNGSRISDGNYLFLHGRYVSTYSETELFIYRDGYIYSSNGKYVRSLTLPMALAQISPQRGMYARGYHLQFAPCGGFTNPTGAVLLDM